VALIGGTFIEREQRYGYLETALTIANPDKTITFRNLGWSGDTVGGVSRSGFDPPEAGFKQLIDQVNAVKPTVIIVGYGANESFAGKAGLDAFVKDYERLLEALRPTKARFILLAPLKSEKLASPLPDPAKHNQDLELYTKAIQDLAKLEKATFVVLDPYADEGSSSSSAHLTDNGIHLTEYGYWKLAGRLKKALRLRAKLSRKVDSDERSGADISIEFEHTPIFFRTVSGLLPESIKHGIEWKGESTPQHICFTVTEGNLPLPSDPVVVSEAEKGDEHSHRIMKVKGLAPGHHTLRIDGKPVAIATDEELAKGMRVDGGPEIDQVERLRTTIIRKNRLFFHRWRPQNITYLLGFRKHEQGNNAVEIPQFDPLVEEQEKKIGILKKPVTHVYELTRDDAKGASK
jgi:lysophospholipase L1-like esterase